MKIIFYEVKDWEKPMLQETFQGHELILLSDELDKDNWQTAVNAEIISVFIESDVNQQVLESLHHHQSGFNLQMIATRSTGFDHIDLKTAKQLGIQVCNVPSYGDNTVAEHTFGLILTLSRKIYETIDRTERGKFDIQDLRGFDLQGKTIGIFGLGKIGRHVARIAKGFDMSILAYKRTPDPQLAEEFGLKFAPSLEDLMSESDIFTLHCPLTPDTHHLINEQNIHHFKKGTLFINTARGALIQTEALLKALQEGILSGAGLDVLEEEHPLKEEAMLLSPKFQEEVNMTKLVANHVLIARDDVVFTAHNAFNSTEAVHRILETTIENIKQFTLGNAQNIVENQ